MEPGQAAGIAGFLTQTDAIGRITLAALVAMSVATWYLILARTVRIVAARRRSARFLDIFWNAPSLQAVEAHLEERHPDEPFSHLAWHGIVAARRHERHGANRLTESGSTAEFVTRAMRRVLDEETARCEQGLTVLASVGSTAPFVGLFGTVWAVYHALVAIGMSGKGTLDKVAGPVGEALIMTGIGLVVAVPAVLAYNAFVRSNRVVLSQLDAFAHDLYAFLATGSHVSGPGAVVPLKPAAAAQGSA
ncbi:MAG: MotA/TolQ/ExbB proton channel family protein [Burkholderiales bacterium]|nr:MotA/TolQ/ExbB proton channel family protein [Burkholderiales bacterium]